MPAIDYEPLILTAKATAVPLGGTQQLDDVTLVQNPSRGPILVDEILFDVQSTQGSANTTPPATPGAYGSIMGVKLTLGRVPLTGGIGGGYIPISMLSRVWDQMRESTSNIGNNELPSGGTMFSTPLSIVERYRWKFEKPLWVPPGETLMPSFAYATAQQLAAPANLPTTRDVRITYRARVFPQGTPPPLSISVPWATAWLGTGLTSASAPTSPLKSVESDLYNPFNERLIVREFIGRMFYFHTLGAGSPVKRPVDAFIEDYAGCGLRMVDNDGNICIKDTIPFQHAFSIDRSWRMRADVAPHGFFLAELEPGIASTKTVFPMISMLGYRDVQLNKVAYLP